MKKKITNDWKFQSNKNEIFCHLQISNYITYYKIQNKKKS